MAETETQQLDQPLPRFLAVAVMMERRPARSQWVDFTWDAIGVSVSEATEQSDITMTVVSENEEVSRYLYEGFTLELHEDECESYYHNLMAPHPSCYVVADPDEDGVPHPCLVSLSFDEAHAYLEGEEIVYRVEIPPELYRWTEAYVLTHYVPKKKTKRKLANWKMPSGSKPQ